jgi:hypothetical protein
MRQLIALGRGLAHRAGSAVMIFIVAVVGAAAAAAGPVYYQASQVSILRDTMAGAQVIGRSYEATLTGPISGTLATLRSTLAAELNRDLGVGVGSSLFQAPVESIEGQGSDVAISQTFPLVWQTGFCAHLVIRGACPAKAGEVVISTSTARIAGWRAGSQIRRSGWPLLKVTGVYTPPGPGSDYWVLHASEYFPFELPASTRTAGGLDALFTSRATMSNVPIAQQGTSTVDETLALGRLRVADVAPLAVGLTAFVNSTFLSGQNVIVASTTPTTLASVQAGWRAVAVPVALTTTTVLLLSWLLLFLIVTDAVDARGPEVALAKLRGHGKGGILVFGLSEPATLLLAALPAGVLAGWAGAARLAGRVLLAGTPVGLPWLAWVAAGAAIAGGFAAVLLAAQRTLRRGVVEQFRRPSRVAARRSWVIDAILLTGSAAGLAEVYSTHQIGSASHGVLSLLVPGLLGLAVAVIASRLLPLGCQALYGFTASHGGLAPYLALRHIARRPGGIRTTIVLATAFSLAAFAFTAWSVGQRNYQLVAGARVGAPVVLAVSVPAGANLGALVDRADPAGRLAAVVDTYIGVSGGSVGQYTMGVDPARFAAIAYWPRSLSAGAIARLTAGLAPPAAPPVVLTGDALRVTIDVASMSLPGEVVYANVTTGSSPVTLGALPRRGTVTLTGALVGCPCVLQSLALTLAAQQIQRGVQHALVNGRLTITALDVRNHGIWRPAGPPQDLRTAAAWRDETLGQAVHQAAPPVTTGQQGLTWSLTNVPGTVDPMLGSANTPDPLPALVAAPLVTPGQSTFSGTGLDGHPLRMRTLAVLPSVPGAPTNGVIVDRQYAELAAGESLIAVGQQVWLAAGALPLIRSSLAAGGVRITSQRSAAAVTAQLARQGPGLASVLFLGDAAAAAVLAAGAAILGLYVSARRRRYEYAALEASGVRRRALRGAVLTELAVVLGFGTLVGAATGLAAAMLVLRSVPEFVAAPLEPALSYVPQAGPVAGLLGGAVGLLVISAVVSSMTLIRGIRADMLREAPA